MPKQKQKLKFKRHIKVIPLLLMMTQSMAQLNIDKNSINNGGTVMANGSFTMKASIGQVDSSGNQSGGSFSLNGGFWHPLESTPKEEIIFKNSFEQ